MKYRYRIHPNNFELGENEKFYSDMEAKGWRVVKRGNFLSKFTPVRPSRARYRIEVASYGLMEDGFPIPPEQLGVYEDCGWEYAAGKSPIHVFRAPEGSDAPEFYAEPAEQAEALKPMRRLAWSGVFPFFSIMLSNLLAFGIKQNWDLQHKWFVEDTAFHSVWALLLLYIWYIGLRDLWLISRTCRRLKKGVPLDHNPQKRRTLHRSVCAVFLALIAAGAALAIAQRLGTRDGGLPLTADGPYLLLSDLGYDMERRVPTTWTEDASSLEHTRSLLADYWDVYEVVADGEYWMYQDIYRLRSLKLAKPMAEVLRGSTTFGENSQDCTMYVMPDMVAWVYRDLEIVAVSGNMVAHITWIGSDWTDPNPKPVLEALRERWEEYGIVTDGKTEEQWGVLAE